MQELNEISTQEDSNEAPPTYEESIQHPAYLIQGLLKFILFCSYLGYNVI